MLTQFFSIGCIAVLGAMSPGPDFAIVTKNSLLHSRRSGLFTSLGLGTGISIHMTYCVLGLALLISNSPLLFNLIKYVGAAYLIYLGIGSLLSEIPNKIIPQLSYAQKSQLSGWASYRQGLICNLLNPKATLFFLALFTVIIKPETPYALTAIYAAEIVILTTIWFCSLTFILSHSRVKNLLENSEKYIVKILGVFLIGFGILLAFLQK